jgi:hypothetical protein
MNHLMIDLKTSARNRITFARLEAVFFEPSTGRSGKAFYQTNIRMTTGLINADTAFEWMKKDSHWRAELMSATEAEEGVMCDLAGFIADNTEHRFDSLFVWFKDTPEKLVSLRYAVERSKVLPCFPELQNSAAFALFDLAGVIGYAPTATLLHTTP